jgi:hypothetical protein
MMVRMFKLIAVSAAAMVQGSVMAQCGTTVYDPGGAGGYYGNNAN